MVGKVKVVFGQCSMNSVPSSNQCFEDQTYSEFSKQHIKSKRIERTMCWKGWCTLTRRKNIWKFESKFRHDCSKLRENSTVANQRFFVPITQYTVISDFWPLGVMGTTSHTLQPKVGSDMTQDTHVDDIRPLGPPALRDIPHAPDLTPEHSSLAIQIVDSGSPITMIFPVEADVPDAATAPDSTDIPPGDLDTTVVGYNTHYTDIPSKEETSDDKDRCDNSNSETVEDAVIKKLGNQFFIRCTEGFIEVTPRKNFKINRRRRRY